MEEPFASALTGAGLTHLRDLPLGALVAVVDLVDVIPTEGILIAGEGRWPPEPELSFGNYGLGRFAWMTENLRRFKEPILWKGRQQLFDVPDDVIRKAIAA